MHSALSTSSPLLRWLRRHWVLLAFAAVYLYAFPYFSKLRHANELPRILTTTQLAEHATFRLDERMAELGSLADISKSPNGHQYQNKAPGLSMLALPVYYPVSLAYRLLGAQVPLMLATWLMRVFAITLPALAFLVVFRQISRRFAESEEAQNTALVAYALGSLALPYGIQFMSHALAAVLIGFAFALAVEITRDPAKLETKELKGALGVGALLGTSMLMEYQALFAALIVAGYFVWGAQRKLRAALLLLAGLVPCMAILAAYHAHAYGSPFLTGYVYSVDKANRAGLMGIIGFSKRSILQLLVSVDNGLLLLTPWVLLSIVGGVAIALDREWRARVGREALTAGLIALAYCIFLSVLHPNFARGGWSVGPRYLAVAMPFFGWLAASGLEVCFRKPGLRVPALSLVWVGVLVHVLAATTYPHWPHDIKNPLYEVSLRLLREGHAPHSLGTLFGLRGLASLVPLYLGVLALAAYFLSAGRKYLLEVGLALFLAAFAVSRYERLATTPPETAVPSWKFVSFTAEP